MQNLQTKLNNFKSNHPNSAYAPIFINEINELATGKKEQVARSFFRVSRGNQYGLQFVDYLVGEGLLVLKKVGRKQFLTNTNKKVVDLVSEIEKFMETQNFGIVGWDAKTNTLKLELNVTTKSDGYIIREYNKYTKQFIKSASAILEKYFNQLDTKIQSRNYGDMKAINKYQSVDFIVNKQVTIKAK